MPANNDPIYTRVGDIDASNPITLAANDFTGQGANNVIVYSADKTNGGFIQRLRFKAAGTNIASVARIFINNGLLRSATPLAAVTGTPTGTPSTTGGTLATGSYFAKIYAVDQWGGTTAASTETASVSVTGPTGSIAWAWTAVAGAVSYIISVGPAAGQEFVTFTSTTNSYTQIAPGSQSPPMADIGGANNYFFGELPLPATTAAPAAITGPDLDYVMNFALPPGFNVVVGLGTAVAAGWVVTAIAGKY